MVVAAMKHMASNFAKLDKFEGVDYRRWKKKMHFLLSIMGVVYVLTTLIPKDGDDATVEQLRKRAKWDNDDYVCRGLILNEAKYMAEDASSKNFIVSYFTSYKITDSRPVIEQYNKLFGILERFTQHKMDMDEAIQVSCIIDKLPPSWKYFKHTLKHLKEELTLVELGSHLRIEESLRVQDSDKPKGNNIACPLVVNMIELHTKLHRKCGKTSHIKRDYKGVNVGNKSMVSGTKGSVDGLSNSLKGQNICNKSLQVYNVTYVSEAYFMQDDDVAWWVDSEATVHVYKDRCWFKTYESLNDGSTLHMGNESKALVLGCGYVDLRLGHVYFKRMQDMSKDGLISAFDMDTERLICMHATHSFRNKKYFVTFIRTDRGGEYMDTLYFQSIGIIHETTAPFTPQQNGISKNKNKVLKEMVNFMLSYLGLSQGLWGENRLSSVLRPSLGILKGKEDIGGLVVPEKVTKEVVQQPEPEHRKGKRNKTPKDFGQEFQLYLIEGKRDEIDVKTAFLNGELDKEVYINQPQGFIMPGNKNKVDLTKEFLSSMFSIKDMGEANVIMGRSIKHENNRIAISQSHYIEKPDIAFVVGKLSRSATLRTIRLPVAGYSYLVEVQFLGLPRNKLASLVQQWNLPHDFTAKLAKAYIQIYNGKSRHLGVKHSMIRELITNGVIFIEFVRSQQNLADHLMKGLARDLGIKST
ncbi:zinc finger, CCHC-type containing protein [Tanacetum coccineum]